MNSPQQESEAQMCTAVNGKKMDMIHSAVPVALRKEARFVLLASLALLLAMMLPFMEVY